MTKCLSGTNCAVPAAYALSWDSYDIAMAGILALCAEHTAVMRDSASHVGIPYTVATLPEPNAGVSNCGKCRKRWVVTPSEDCLVPSCGHWGDDTSENNLRRPCEPCGLAHAYACITKEDHA